MHLIGGMVQSSVPPGGSTGYTVTTGTAAYIPGNSEHGIRNTGTGPLRFFYVFAVGSFAEIEYRFTSQQ